MSPLGYLRPESKEDAVEHLDFATPLGGGTAITPQRNEHSDVIDLSLLGLNEIEVTKEKVVAGAMVTLKEIIDHAEMPATLCAACLQEAGANMRNAATMAGAIITADGRSSLAAVLLAMDAYIETEPDSKIYPLIDLWKIFTEVDQPRVLVTAIHAAIPAALEYSQVARSPSDRSIVSVTVARFEKDDEAFRVVLGGYGAHPRRVMSAEVSLGSGDVEEAANAAIEHLAKADDAWASGEYRAEAAGILVARLAREIGAS